MPGYAIRDDGTVDGNLIPLQSEIHFVAKPTPTAFVPPTLVSEPVSPVIQANINGGSFSIIDVANAPKVETTTDMNRQRFPVQSTLFPFGAPITSSKLPTAPTHALPAFSRINFKPQIFQPQPFSQNPNRFVNKFITTTAPTKPAPLPQPSTNADSSSNRFEIIVDDNQLTTTTEYEVPSTTVPVPIISRISFGEATTVLSDDYTTVETTTGGGFETTTFTTEWPTEPLTTEPATTMRAESTKAPLPPSTTPTKLAPKFTFNIIPQASSTHRPDVQAPEVDLLPPFDPNNATKSIPVVEELVLEILPPQISQPSLDLLPPITSNLSDLPNNSADTTSPTTGNQFLPVLDLNPFLPPFSQFNPSSAQNGNRPVINPGQPTRNSDIFNGNASRFTTTTTTTAPVIPLQSTTKLSRGDVKFTSIGPLTNTANGENADNASSKKYMGGFGAPAGVLSPH